MSKGPRCCLPGTCPSSVSDHHHCKIKSDILSCCYIEITGRTDQSVYYISCKCASWDIDLIINQDCHITRQTNHTLASLSQQSLAMNTGHIIPQVSANWDVITSRNSQMTKLTNHRYMTSWLSVIIVRYTTCNDTHYSLIHVI